jgi:hypothetical protein
VLTLPGVEARERALALRLRPCRRGSRRVDVVPAELLDEPSAPAFVRTNTSASRSPSSLSSSTSV